MKFAIPSRPTITTPEPGMGVTVQMWSDRYAGTIVSVSPSGKSFQFRRDRAIRRDKNGMSEVGQDYLYEIDPTAKIETARLAKDGTFRLPGGKRHGSIVRLGYRKAYHDYSF